MNLAELSRLSSHPPLIIIDFDGTLTCENGTECHHIFQDYWPSDYNDVDWWAVTHDNITKDLSGKLLYSDFAQNVASTGPQLVPLACDFLTKVTCPVIILSAGIHDIISLVLEKHGICNQNIHIVSNKMVWGEDGVFQGFEDPCVTSDNKTEHVPDRFLCYKAIVAGDDPRDLSVGSLFQHSVKILVNGGGLSGVVSSLLTFAENTSGSD